MTAMGVAAQPVIGIGAHEGQVRLAGSDRHLTFVPQVFIDRVAATGCVPLLMPPIRWAWAAVDLLDGLLLLAGPDVDPASYEAERHPKTGWVDLRRDAAEFALIDAALRIRLPILGICRGLEMLNIRCNGTLHQHLPDIIGHEGHLPGQNLYGPQRLRLKPGSYIAAILGGETATVPCHHHQAIDRLGAGLTATAWSQDGTIEAVEACDHPFAVGVQWHAEESEDNAIFEALAEAANTASPRNRGQRPVRGAGPGNQDGNASR